MKLHLPSLALWLSLALSGLWQCAADSDDAPPPCTRPDEFDAVVLVEHDGSSLDSMGEPERVEMGKAFVRAWDAMNHPSHFSFCDKTHFRHITRVEVVEEGEFHTRQETPVRLGRKTYLYTLKGGCVNGCNNYRLFAPSTTTLNSVIGQRKLGVFNNAPGSYTPCTCNSGKEDRGPTEGEFLEKFKQEITISSAAQTLTHVKTVNAVIEYLPFACSDYVYDYNEDVAVDFTKPVTEADEEPLEEGYVEAVNMLSKYYCDQGDDQVLSAHMLPVNANVDDGHHVRRRLATRLFRATKTKRKKKESGLFQDGERKLTVAEGTYKVLKSDGSEEVMTAAEYDSSRIGASYKSVTKALPAGVQTYDVKVGSAMMKVTQADLDRWDEDKVEYEVDSYSHTCYCPVRPIAYRAPNEAEITLAYNAQLAYEASKEQTTKSYGATNVVTTCSSCSGSSSSD